MHNLFQSFGAFGLIFLTFLSGGHHTINAPQVHPSPTVYESKHSEEIFTAMGSVTKFGQTVNFTFIFPKEGGKIHGTINGACHGPIQGDYSGGTNGTITGTAHATCPVLLTTLTGNAVFSGNVDAAKNSFNLLATISGEGITQSLTIPANLVK